MSSIEAEYIAKSEITKETVWLKRVIDGFKEFGMKWKVSIFQSDSISAIQYGNRGFEKGTRDL